MESKIILKKGKEKFQIYSNDLLLARLGCLCAKLREVLSVSRKKRNEDLIENERLTGTNDPCLKNDNKYDMEKMNENNISDLTSQEARCWGTNKFV